MLDIFIKSIKPELSFQLIEKISFSLDELIENLNENNFIDRTSRDHFIDYLSYLIKRQKFHEKRNDYFTFDNATKLHV